MAYPASLSTTTPAATVRLPADGPLKILWGGDGLTENVHAALPDQRWAYDIAQAPFLTGSSVLTDYGCYGIPVVAPASGVVVLAHDGEPDMTPGAASNNFDAPEGNVIALRLQATGTYLIIAHLKPGSLRVEVGEPVVEGQPLARCGNSGNTSEPHIHLHHQRQDPSLHPINWAEGLPLFFRDHTGSPMPAGGIRTENGQPVAIGETVQHLTRPAGQRVSDPALGYSATLPPEWEACATTVYSRVYCASKPEAAALGFPAFFLSVIPAGVTDDDGAVYNFIPEEIIGRFLALPIGGTLTTGEPNPEHSTFTRLPDVSIGGETWVVLENSKVWEGRPDTKDRRMLLVREDQTYMLGAYYQTEPELSVVEWAAATFELAR